MSIVTPEGVRRRVSALDSAWQALARSVADMATGAGTFVREEVIAWREWRDSVLESFTDQLFATGTLDELDQWQSRYEAAYGRVKTARGGAAPMAPTPGSVQQDGPAPAVPPAFAVGLLVFGGGLLAAYFLGGRHGN